MTIIVATDAPLYFAAHDGAGIVATGLTDVGGLTVSGMTLLSAPAENDFLGLCVGLAGDYDPLPVEGTWMEAGDIYGYEGGLVIVRQAHSRTFNEPVTVPDLFSVYREDGGILEWVANEFVKIGAKRYYEDVLYAALQDHTTQVDWCPTCPSILGLLWGVVSVLGEWAIGVTYRIPDEVTYMGATYKCLQGHTSIATWCPTCPGILNLLWELVE